jgi:hypothetical protein
MCYFSFRLYDLQEEEAYVIDLDVSVCLESGAACSLKQTVLSQAVLPKPQCALAEGFKRNSKSPETVFSHLYHVFLNILKIA